jgi:hypothetical protein
MSIGKKDVIFYICVTIVLSLWTITGHLEDQSEIKAQKEIALEAIKNGYIECLINDRSYSTETVWKKTCNE